VVKIALLSVNEKDTISSKIYLLSKGIFVYSIEQLSD